MNKNWAIAIIVIIALGASNVYLLLRDAIQESPSAPKPAQTPATLEKLKIGGPFEAEIQFLILDAARERGIFARYGLEPELISTRPYTAVKIKEHVSSGIKIGVAGSSELLLARSDGVPIKAVAGTVGFTPAKVFAKAEGPIKTIKDLDGKKIGTSTSTDPTCRIVLYLANKFSIKPEPVPVGNLTNMVVALKLGRHRSFLTFEGAPLRLVDSGELRIVVDLRDVFPRAWVVHVAYATEDIIQQNPDLVRRFVKAWLESVRYLKDNPNYARDLFIKRSNAPQDLADKVVSQIDWRPDGRGSGGDLAVALGNLWQYTKDTGVVPPGSTLKIEEAVDVRFLP